MSGNPELLSPAEAAFGFAALITARSEARERFEEQGEAAANAEHAYRKTLALKFGEHRGAGQPVGASEILARSDAADHALERDLAEIRMKASRERIEECEAERSTLNRLAEWSMRAGG